MESRAVWGQLWPCFFYLSCSLLMNVVNKSIFALYEWPFIYTMAASQNLLTFCFVSVFSLFNRHQSDKKPHILHRMLRNRQTLLSVGFISFLNLGNVLVGFASLRLVNMPMYLVLRRLSTIKIMLFEMFFLNKVLSYSMQLSLLVVACGSLVAGFSDLSFSTLGYSLTILQNLFTASNLVFTKKFSFTPVEVIFVNSLIGSIVCSILAIVYENPAAIVLNFPYLYDPNFQLCFLLMCSMSIVYQFSVYVCVSRNSPLAASVTGNIKDLLSTIFGYILFNNGGVSKLNLIGVGISFVGAYSYTYLKMKAINIPLKKCDPEVLRGFTSASKSIPEKAKLSQRGNAKRNERGNSNSNKQLSLDTSSTSSDPNQPTLFSPILINFVVNKLE